MTSNAMHHASGAIHSVAPAASTSLGGPLGGALAGGSLGGPGAMDVDQPSTSSGFGTLKRCNSAPMINVLMDQPMPGARLSPPEPPPPRKDDTSRRVRHFSSSSICLHAAPPPPSSLKLPSRLHQIKHEDKQAATSREAASEKEFQSTMQISQSWEELRLDETYMNMNMSCTDSTMVPMARQRSLSESVHVHTSGPAASIQANFFSPASGSPSPTRIGNVKQCFSPSMQAPVRNMTLTPSPSPSPTRKTFQRSLSPIAMKPSSLSLKRKLDCDDQSSFNHFHSPAKKFHSGHGSSSTPSTPDRAPLAHPLAHSISSSHLELDGQSPEQAVPQGLHTSPILGLGPAHVSPAHSHQFSGHAHQPSPQHFTHGLLQTVDPFQFRPVVSEAQTLATPSNNNMINNNNNNNNTCDNDHPMTNSH